METKMPIAVKVESIPVWEIAQPGTFKFKDFKLLWIKGATKEECEEHDIPIGSTYVARSSFVKRIGNTKVSVWHDKNTGYGKPLSFKQFIKRTMKSLRTGEYDKVELVLK